MNILFADKEEKYYTRSSLFPCAAAREWAPSHTTLILLSQPLPQKTIASNKLEHLQQLNSNRDSAASSNSLGRCILFIYLIPFGPGSKIN